MWVIFFVFCFGFRSVVVNLVNCSVCPPGCGLCLGTVLCLVAIFWCAACMTRMTAILNPFSEVGGRPCPDVLRGGLGAPVVAAVLVVATRAVSVCPQSVAWHVLAQRRIRVIAELTAFVSDFLCSLVWFQ